MRTLDPHLLYRSLTWAVAVTGLIFVAPAFADDRFEAKDITGGSASDFVRRQPEKLKDISRDLESVPKTYGVPGVSVAVVKSGRVAAAGSAGVRQVGNISRIRNGDRFHLGSCTKRMTGLMIYRLIDQHKLRWDSTLAENLPHTPMLKAYRMVTIKQLLQFKGGIQPYLMIGPRQTPELFLTKGTAEDQRKSFVAHVLLEPPVVAPGSKAVYSNASFAVLAYVASKATGKTWERLMEENVFKPLDMRTAGFGRPYSASSPNNPRGHFRVSGGWKVEDAGFIHPASLSAAGDVSASMPDFAKYAAEELRIARGNSRLLSRRTAVLMNKVSPVVEGRTYLGGAGAFTAGITLWPKLDFAVVAGVNGGGGESLCRSVAQALEKTFVESKPFSLSSPPRPRNFGFMLGLDESGNPIVGGVAPGSLALQAGLREGDEIVAMNGLPIGKIPDEQRFAALRGPMLRLKVRRKGRMLDIKLELGQ